MNHPYVISSQVPVNLMGQDLLIKLGANILCGPDGLTVTFPDGLTVDCGTPKGEGQWLLADPTTQTADIYWGELNTTEGIVAGYTRWRPWVMALDVYSTPVHPLHVTLFYDRNEDDCCWDAFKSSLENKTCDIQTRDCYVGPQGVAAEVVLTEEQSSWYRMADESVPHVSLATHAGHQAKDLGPMVQSATRAVDCVTK